MNQPKLINGRYEVHNLTSDRIGQGGMGDVYRAVDTHTGQTVAIKHLKPERVASDPTLVERFAREGEALRRLNHPNIVAVLETAEENGQHYIIMEYVPGGSLLELLEDQEQLPVHRATHIALELADALARAHHLNIVHRDIKPGNVLLAADGTPRLTDFGVAHMGDMGHITREGVLTGTYVYLSPEACNGEPLDSRTDIWSFGILLYEMLAGRLPFDEPNLIATITAILTHPLPDMIQFRPGLPEALTNLVHRMLEKDKKQRIGSMRLVGAQLEAILSGMGGELLPEAAKSRFGTPTPVRKTAPLLGPRHNLPLSPTPFIGRSAEVADIVALLQDPDCRLLTLVGAGGMGKTRLSVEAAKQALDLFRHGVRFVPLAGVAAAEFLVTAVADALNFTFFDDSDPQTQLLQYLRDKEMLLVMDNFEHLLAGADLVSQILNHAPGLKVLATSRESLNLWEEWSRPVQGMSYPDKNGVVDVEPYSALKLFADRARRVRYTFSLREELPHVIHICQLVEGMPLGIELAASWLKVLSPEQIANEIRKNLDFLASNVRNIPTRHRSIRAVFDYSWQLLSTEERLIFARLSVFQGGFSRETAETVAGASLQTLTNLTSKSLLYGSDEGRGFRYSMHELLKQYAANKLAESAAENHHTQEKHAAFFTQWLRQQYTPLRGPQYKIAYDAIRTELENVRTAWKWAVQHRQLLLLDQAADTLTIFYDGYSSIQEVEEMFSQALTAVSQITTPPDPIQHALTRARLLVCKGMATFRTPRRWQSLQLFQQSLDILNTLLQQPDLDKTVYQETEHLTILPLIYGSFAIARTQSHEAATQYLTLASERCRRLGDYWGLGRAINARAILTLSYNIHETIHFYQESLQVARQVGDPVMLGRALMNLSNYCNQAEAQKMLQEALDIYESLDNLSGKAFVYGRLSNLVVVEGSYQLAKSYLSQALTMYREIGFYEHLTGTLLEYGGINWVLGETAEARQAIEQSVALLKESGDVDNLIKGLNILGMFALDMGEHEEARQHYKTALAVLPQLNTARQIAEASDSLGNFALTLGEYGAARTHFEQAVPLFEQAQDKTGIAWAIRNFGKIAYELGD